MKKGSKNTTGIIHISGKGIGYLKANGEDIAQIEEKDLNTASNGDEVEVTLSLHKKGGIVFGRVQKVLSRSKEGFVGVLKKNGKKWYVEPDDFKLRKNIHIPAKFLNGAKKDQKVFVKIIAWGNQKLDGRVMKVIGKPKEHEVEIESIMLEKGIDTDFPEKVDKEALELHKRGITKEDYKNRRDFRNTLTFTIDPKDAKDFDDALSYKEIKSDNGETLYEIGIHIADVTYFVNTKSEMEKEAAKRATSVYLVDRTIPMLPAVLSNDLCSLVPNEDRLTVSAVFTLDSGANVRSSWFGRTLIHSQRRFTYEEAETAIKNSNSEFHKEISTLNNLAKKIAKRRFENGAISIEQEEVKFVLDEKGKPIKVIKKQIGDSNKLIEEFMLLANKKVAELLSKATKKKGVSVYRVHEEPSREKMEDLAFFLKSLGYKFEMQKGIITNKSINKILEEADKTNEKDSVNKAVTRSMAKAVYSIKNTGHYGLAFEYYTHFTSPIRRYPDMVVHRLLLEYLDGRKINDQEIKTYEKISNNSSAQERKAMEAERMSIKYKQVEYMHERIGQVFDGVISGVTEWGLFVEEVETKCEGLVKASSMKDDFYVLNEKHLELVGERTKKKYKLGDRVKIKTQKVDLDKRTIDYVLV